MANIYTYIQGVLSSNLMQNKNNKHRECWKQATRPTCLHRLTCWRYPVLCSYSNAESPGRHALAPNTTHYNCTFLQNIRRRSRLRLPKKVDAWVPSKKVFWVRLRESLKIAILHDLYCLSMTVRRPESGKQLVVRGKATNNNISAPTVWVLLTWNQRFKSGSEITSCLRVRPRQTSL